MAVGVRGRPHLCVAKHLHDDSGVDPLGQQQGRRGVPAVVQADLAHARLAEEGLPGAPIRLALDRPTVGLSEDQVVVLPEQTGVRALLELSGAVGSQRLHEWVW